MSSPDPLNDETTFLAPPSSQRVTRSHRSTRFASLGRSVSPRKQQFELEVGDNRSPQRLLVTVETEDEDAPATGTRRRLFPSSSPFKGGSGMAATTTTVPLKESIEDEYGDGSLTTPKKRGRPRKTNGTPIPSAAKKRRAPTPMKRTPKRANTGRDEVSSSVEPSQPTPTPKRRGRPPKNSVEPPSDAGSQLEPMSEPAQPTPTPKRRGRPPKNRSIEPSSDLGIGSQKKTSAAKGRRRRQALAPEDLENMAEEPEILPAQQEINDEDAIDLIGLDENVGANEEAAPASATRDQNSDIWMTTMSNQATPRAATRNSRSASAASPTPARGAPVEPPVSDMESVASQAEGFGDGAPSVSDAGSIMDGPYHSATRRNDTVAQEDFSMIFMDSIQSYQELRSSKQGPQPLQEIGEESNEIINNTLESLRQDAEIEGEPAGENELNAEEPTGVVHEAVDENMEEDVDEMDLIGAPEELAEEVAEEMNQPEPAESEAIAEAMDDAPSEEDEMEHHIPEDRTMAEPGANDEQDFDHDDDIAMAQQDAFGNVEEPGDEPMAEHAVPELDGAAGSSSSPQPADEPDEPEVVQTSSPIRSAGLSSKFGASPWLSRTPRRPNVSPLRRQVLNSIARDDRPPRASQRYNSSPSGMGPEQAQNEESPRFAQDDSNLYEDSFSEIPEAVLTAATPGRAAPVPFVEAQEEEPAEVDDRLELVGDVPEEEEPEHELGPDADPQEDLVPLEEEQQQEAFGYVPASQVQPAAPSNASSVAQTDNGRLPTPDDTPPNVDVEADQPDKSTQASVASPTPDPQTQLASEHAAASSPARQNNALQPPRISVERGSSSVPEITPVNQISSPIQNPPSTTSQTSPEKGTRPALSAIVRAGRVLQSVTSDPPSPGDRQNQLGSPFKSSASKESRSGSREPTSQRPSASPGRRSTGYHRKSASIDRLNDDPFASRPNIPRGQGNEMQAFGLSVNENTNKAQNSNPGSAAGSVRFTPQHEEMSWLPDAEPANPSPSHGHSLNEAAQSSPSRRPESLARSSASRPEEPADRDDETDIWEIEAQRDEPDSSRKETSFLSMTSAPIHRRPAIPSPWTRKSELAQANTSQFAASRTSNGASRIDEGQQQDDDGEGYSLLAQRQKALEAEAAKGPDSSAKANRFDLSSFFSSPAAIGGKLAEKFFPSRTARQEEPETAEEETVMPHSTMFPAVPQRQFEPSSEGRTELFSPARSQEPQQSRSPSQKSQASQYALAQAQEGEEEEVAGLKDVVDASASPETPERLERPISAQKKDFTPRPRQTNQSFFQPSSARSGAITPPRMQLSHDDIERWQQETSNASSDEPTSPRQFLRPLPPRHASPSKSAIRSPLKPRTPGRVVEFTSSVLSPIEQARQRQERRASFLQDDEDKDAHQLAPGPAIDGDEEEEEEDVWMANAPQAKSSDPKALSKDEWTREHWLFLDKLLQHRKTSRFGIECEPRSKRFLGKTVNSKGESLKLEQWHLDCVDAFKAVVGGWDEGALCKRLFALIKGEEKRAQLALEDEQIFH